MSRSSLVSLSVGGLVDCQLADRHWSFGRLVGWLVCQLLDRHCSVGRLVGLVGLSVAWSPLLSWSVGGSTSMGRGWAEDGQRMGGMREAGLLGLNQQNQQYQQK